jgi:hypothetical protein
MDHAGDIVGRYRLLRQLGAGRMGTVWMATRDDGALDREVALKLLHEDLGGTEPQGRFLREREILGGLDHPGIARILDAGETAEGRPFCVMEAVDGLAIDKHCAEHGLRDRERRLLTGEGRGGDPARELSHGEPRGGPRRCAARAELDASLARIVRSGMDTMGANGAANRTRAELMKTIGGVALSHDAPELRRVATEVSLELAEEWRNSGDEKLLELLPFP